MLAGLIACAGGSDNAPRGGATSAAAGASVSSAAWTMNETGWGPVRAGMTVGDARSALGGQLPEPTSDECAFVRPAAAPPGLRLMTVGGRVVRVDVIDTTVATAAGARVGDSETRINTLYAGRVQTGPHKYTDGHYLIVRRGTNADSVYRLVFETDGQRVTRYRGGRIPEVEWVEGCG